MLTRIVTPLSRCDVGLHDSIVFLAGPIQGAEDWQSQAIRIMSSSVNQLSPSVEGQLIIASPRTIGQWHGDYNGQVDWETEWLATAGEVGCILFWCAKESQHFCERPHGQTTRFELGEWIGRKSYINESIKLSIGIEPGFTNERYIRHRLSQIPDEVSGHWSIPIHNSLAMTCYAALDSLGCLP